VHARLSYEDLRGAKPLAKNETGGHTGLFPDLGAAVQSRVISTVFSPYFHFIFTLFSLYFHLISTLFPLSPELFRPYCRVISTLGSL
jgi:hypothetical protein